MSGDASGALSTPLLESDKRVASAHTSEGPNKPRTPVPLSTETVPGPAGCQHKHETIAGLVEDSQSYVFNRAQMLSKSSFLVQGSQWSGSYVANHLRISPTHRFFLPEEKSPEDLFCSQDAVENSLEIDMRKKMRQVTSGAEEDCAIAPPMGSLPDSCNGRSKIFLWEDAGGQCPLLAEAGTCAEACELPPRIEAFELPCYFSETPERVLIVKRTYTDEVTAMSVVLAAWLQEEWGIVVYVEPLAQKEMISLGARNIEVWTGHEEYTPTEAKCQHLAIDLVISLGGDGTTLWISTMFPDVVPPVFGVTLGSLSYLNQFKQDEVLDKLTPILSCRPFRVQLRARLFVALVDADDVPRCASHCVNECVIDRGPLSTMASIDVYVNDRLFTNVSADGLILATPTGSTAYSMSAGGPMVHPNVPCLLFTPISAHSLSMRPLILPDTATLRLRNPMEARNNLWVSLDGRARRELGRDDSVLVSLSPFPFPLICKSTCECGDAWLQALTDNLNWGLRVRQRRHDTEARCIERLTSRTVLDFSLPDSFREWFQRRSNLGCNPKQPSQSLSLHRRTLAGPLTPDELFPKRSARPEIRGVPNDNGTKGLSSKTASEEGSPSVLHWQDSGPPRSGPPVQSNRQLNPPASEDSSTLVQSVPNTKATPNGVSWSQLFAGSSRARTLDLPSDSQHHRGYSLATESVDSSLDSRLENHNGIAVEKEESPRRSASQRGVIHSRSNVSLHKHSALHHSPFVQPIQKLRAAIAISPGQPREPHAPGLGSRERSD